MAKPDKAQQIPEESSNFTASMPDEPIMTGENAKLGTVPGATAAAPTEESKPKRGFKLSKDLVKNPGKVTITAISGTKGERIFDPDELPEDIQKKLIPFGLSHKLGDAAAGLAGVEAEEAIDKVWDGLLKGDWAVRGPASPKVPLKDLMENFSKLSDDEKQTAALLLKTLGINLPGLTDASDAQSANTGA